MFRTAIFSFIYIIFSYSGGFAQLVTLSAEGIDDPGYEHVKVMGQEENGFYLLQSNMSLLSQSDRVGFKNRKYKISYYNYAMQPIWSKSLEEVKDQGNIELVMMFDEHPFVLTSQWQRSENTITYFGELYDAAGKSIISVKKIATVTYDKSGEVRKARMVVSQNEKKAAIVVEEDRELDKVLHLLTIDSALNLEVYQKPVINYTAKQFELSDVVLANGKQIAAIGQSIEKNVGGQKGKLIRYKLFLLRNGESTFEESTIASGDKHITEAALSMDNTNEKAVVAGFYNDVDSYAGTGILFASSHLNNKLPMEIKSVSIDENAKLKMVGERNSGANTGLYSYPIRKLILRSDGGAVIVAEAAYYSEYSYYDYFTQSFTRRTEYHYDNVVIMSIHSNGSIDWSGVLRKSQETMDDGGFLSSFCTVLQSDRIDIVYNNDIGRNNEIALFSVSNKGLTDQKTIARSAQHISVIPNSCKQVDENTLIGAAIQKKRLFLVKFEL